jgi:hypothetical protein
MHVELRLDQTKAFPEIPDAGAVSTLRVWNCKYRSLDPLRRFENLVGLDVFSFPDSSLEALSDLRQLRFLSIGHLPRVTDLAPIGNLKSLTALRLATAPSWDSSGKRTIVDSYEPLVQLEKLRHIELLSVVPADRSLASLERLPHLETGNFHGFPKKEVERFFASSGTMKAHVPKPDF